jgi:phage terminase large subunit-like protein
VAKYEGTKVGRQELWGELLDPEEEGIVKRSWWRIWPDKKPLPKFQVILMSLDTAFSEKQHDKKKQTNDPTACTVWGGFTWKKEFHVMLLDAWEEWLGLPDLIKKVKRERRLTYGDSDEPMLRPSGIRAKNKPKHQGKKIDMILIEEKASGISLMQSLAAEDILTTGYNPGNADKLTRLHLTSPMWAHRRVWCIESDTTPGEPKSYMDPCITQVCSFIGEGSIERDDLMDTSTQAMRVFMDQYIGPLTIKKDPIEVQRQKARMAAEKAKKKERGGNPYDG